MSTGVRYVFEEVEGCQGTAGNWEFLVRWKPSWVVERYLRDSAVVKEYVSRNGLAKLASAKGKTDVVPENYPEKYLDSIISVQHHKGKAPKRQFMLQWKSTWEPQDNFTPKKLQDVLEKFDLFEPKLTSNFARQERPVSRQSEEKFPQKEAKGEKVSLADDPPVSPALPEIPIKNNALSECGMDINEVSDLHVSLGVPMDMDESWFAASPETQRGDLHSLEKRMERLALKDSVDNSLVRKLSQLTLGDSANSSLLSSPGRRTFWEELDTSDESWHSSKENPS